MNKNVMPLILIVLSLGIYFTFTREKIDELKSIQTVNEEYQKALNDSKTLINERDNVLKTYNQLDPEDKMRLEKMVPDNEDNVRLIIDLNGVASKHGISIRNIKTATPKDSKDSSNGSKAIVQPGSYNTVTVSFDTTTSYVNFLNFLKALQASLRIMEVSKISLKANDTGNYDYNVELKTFWLKE